MAGCGEYDDWANFPTTMAMRTSAEKAVMMTAVVVATLTDNGWLRSSSSFDALLLVLFALFIWWKELGVIYSFSAWMYTLLCCMHGSICQNTRR